MLLIQFCPKTRIGPSLNFIQRQVNTVTFQVQTVSQAFLRSVEKSVGRENHGGILQVVVVLISMSTEQWKTPWLFRVFRVVSNIFCFHPCLGKKPPTRKLFPKKWLELTSCKKGASQTSQSIHPTDISCRKKHHHFPWAWLGPCFKGGWHWVGKL